MAGYSLCFDNVQFESKVKHHTMEKKKSFHLYALAFAIKDRIPPPLPPPQDADDREDSQTVPAVDLPCTAFIPSSSDLGTVKEYMTIIVQRTLVDFVPFLEELKHRVVRHVPHQYSEELQSKSEVNNLGIIDANPSNTGETIQILDHLKKYVPTNDGKPVNIACHGDGLTIECITKAKKARATFRARDYDLGCIKESPQEFHKEGINLEVFCIIKTMILY